MPLNFFNDTTSTLILILSQVKHLNVAQFLSEQIKKIIKTILSIFRYYKTIVDINNDPVKKSMKITSLNLKNKDWLLHQFKIH